MATTDDLFEAARAAMARCHAPYSNYPVGAAIRTEDGRVFSGCNIEVASFPEGWCAETTALAHYVMGGGGKIAEILVTAEKADRATPCGGCRQRLAEFAGPDNEAASDRPERRRRDADARRHLPARLHQRGHRLMEAVDILTERLQGLAPQTALVLGSGLGGLVDEVENPVRIPYGDLPGFPASGVTGHAGEVVAGTLAGTPVIMLSGRAHYYEHANAAAMRPALEALAGIGVEKLLLTNAAGSLDPDMPPGSVMLIADHINFSGSNPLFGEPSDRRFVGLSEAYDSGLRSTLEKAAVEAGVTLHKGVYMWFSGPSFETPAEINMARIMGANAVGMSTVPEVIIARFLGLRVAACSVITNLAAGMSAGELSHQETKDMAPLGGRRLAAVLKAAFAAGLS